NSDVLRGGGERAGLEGQRLIAAGESAREHAEAKGQPPLGGQHDRHRSRGPKVPQRWSDPCRRSGLVSGSSMTIDPRGKDLKRFPEEDPGGPVVMLNLLRFAEGGRELYAQYAQALEATFLPRYGGEVLFVGDGSTPLVAEAGQDWDVVALVRYPSREAFS